MYTHMTVDFIVIANVFDQLMEGAEALFKLFTHAFTTPPSILTQNCAFLTIFLASCKILITSCHCECCIASTSPELLRASDVEGPDNTAIGIIHCSPGEANETACDLAFQPENPRYPTRRKVRILEEKSGERNGNEAARSKISKQRQARKKQKYP
ncbi:hypothetical protein B0H13DRAFT_1852535 [Mycena leptocephala]|nr:hypothetical protein B0H13DRAFT_1852535 [Mycena leptocephala]